MLAPCSLRRRGLAWEWAQGCLGAVAGICATGCIPSAGLFGIGYLICLGVCTGAAMGACKIADSVAKSDAEDKAAAKHLKEAKRHAAAIKACNKIVIMPHCHPKP